MFDTQSALVTVICEYSLSELRSYVCLERLCLLLDDGLYNYMIPFAWDDHRGVLAEQS